MEELLVQMSKIQDIMTSAISSPSRTPMSSPFGLSPNPPASAVSPGSQITSSEPLPNAQSHPMADLNLSEPMLDVDDWKFGHNIDSQLRLSENFSFPGVTLGDEYRHVKLASPQEQQQFIEQITVKKEFIELYVYLKYTIAEGRYSDLFGSSILSVTFIWRRPGASDGVRIVASDRGKVLLIKNGQAVEDIWTLNHKNTIRFRQRGM